MRTIKLGEESNPDGDGANPPCPSGSMGHHNQNRGETLNEDANEGSVASFGASAKATHPPPTKSVGRMFFATEGRDRGK